MEANRDKEPVNRKPGMSDKGRLPGKPLLLATGFLFVIVLVASVLIIHFMNNGGTPQTSNAVNNSAAAPGTTTQNKNVQPNVSGSKAINHSVAVTGTMRIGLATCGSTAKRLLIIGTTGKTLYVVSAVARLSMQLQPPNTHGRPVQISGTVQGGQTICYGGKTKSVPILKVSKIELY